MKKNDPNVNKISVDGEGGKRYHITIGTDIIDHIESSRAFGKESMGDAKAHGRFQRRMISLPNKKTKVVTPMSVTIGNRHELFIVCNDEASGGWKKYELSNAFITTKRPSPKVTAVSAAATDDDKITIAVAVEDEKDKERSRIFIAYDLQSATQDWDKVQWTDCGTRKEVSIPGIRVLYNKDNTWTTVLSGKEGPKDDMYLISSKMKEQLFRKAIVYSPMVKYEEIHDFKVGALGSLGGGMFILGMNEGTTSLTFRQFPKIDAEGKLGTIPPGIALPCPPKANVIETGRLQKSGTNLYIAGEGLYQLTAKDMAAKRNKSKLVTIAETAIISDVQDLAVTERDTEDINVWALSLKGDLMLFRQKPEETEWPATSLRKNVQAFAPSFGDEKLSSSLLVVDTKNKASFLTRDKTKGIWNEQPLTIQDKNATQKITCYGTTFRVLNDNDVPLADSKVTVSASRLCNVQIDGASVFIGPDMSYTTTVNSNGSITVYDKARSASPAFYRFAIEGVKEVLDVDPSTTLSGKLRSVTADELNKATITSKTGKAESLLPKGLVDSKELEAVCQTLNRLSDQASGSNINVPGVWKVMPRDPFSTALSKLNTPEVGNNWALQATTKGMVLLNNEAADKIIQGATSASKGFMDAVGSIGETISDLFSAIGEKISKGWTFVLKTIKRGAGVVYEFIFVTGQSIKKFMVKALDEIGGFLTMLLGHIKVGLEKVWNWVKFAFNWDDILLTRDALVKLFDHGLGRMDDMLVNLEKPVIGFFDDIEKKIKPLLGEKYLKMREDAEERGKERKFSLPKVPSIPSPIDLLLGNSFVTGLTEQLKKLLEEVITIEGNNPIRTFSNALSNFVTALLSDEARILFTTFDALGVQLGSLIKGKVKKFSDIDMSLILEIVKVIGLNTLISVLQGIKVFVQKVFKLFRDLLQAVKDLAHLTIRLPLVEKIIKLFSNSDVQVSFSIINVFMLVLAVPTTVVYKSTFNEAPFKKGDNISFASDVVFAQATVKTREAPVWKKVKTILMTIYSVVDSGWSFWQSTRASGTTSTSPTTDRTHFGPRPDTTTFSGKAEALLGSLKDTTAKTGKELANSGKELIASAKSTATAAKDKVMGIPYVGDAVEAYNNKGPMITLLLCSVDIILEVTDVSDTADAICLAMLCLSSFTRILAAANDGPQKEVMKAAEAAICVVRGIIRAVDHFFFTGKTTADQDWKLVARLCNETRKASIAVLGTSVSEEPYTKATLYGVAFLTQVGVGAAAFQECKLM